MILPPKRKKAVHSDFRARQNSSFLKGPREKVWGCDVDDVDFVEPPLELDVNPPSGGVSDDRNGEFHHAAATPTNVAPWSTDGEPTPRFSSNFPSTHDSDALREEDHRDAESLETTFSCPAGSHAP